MNEPATLAPGSGLARRRGCSCPVVRNQFGDGLDEDRFEDAPPMTGLRVATLLGRRFWVSPDCEVHGDDAGKEAAAA